MNFHPAADNQQARGDRSRKELADVGPGSCYSFSLTLQCQMAGPILLAAFWCITAGTAWLCRREGGGSAKVSRLWGSAQANCAADSVSQLPCRGLSLRLNLNTSPVQERPQHPEMNERRKHTMQRSLQHLSDFWWGRSHVLTASTHTPNCF